MKHTSKEFRLLYPSKEVADHKTEGYVYDGNFHVSKAITEYKLTKRKDNLGIKCYRVFDHEDKGLFRYTYVKPDLNCKIEEFYEYE